MTAKKGISYREELIKEALRRELDSIEPPPPELMWRRIQSRLGQKARAPVPLLRRIAWQRYSAAAAALFIFLLGGLGIYRALQAPDPSMPEITRDNGEVDLLGTENQPAWDFPAGWTPAAEPDPPFRASSIEGDSALAFVKGPPGDEIRVQPGQCRPGRPQHQDAKHRKNRLLQHGRPPSKSQLRQCCYATRISQEHLLLCLAKDRERACFDVWLHSRLC